MTNFSDGNSQTYAFPQPKTFANVSQTNSLRYPSKKQAIVIDTTTEISTEEYIYAIGDIVNPTNIIYASTLYNNRLCIFLKSAELVQKILSNHPIITIKNINVHIRWYINPHLRIIMPRVCPSIPDYIIGDALIALGLQLMSPITPLGAGLRREGYTHILSSKRQVFVANDEKDKHIPDYLMINFENTDYKIYLLTDTTCFTCKQKGHVANRCPNKRTNNSTQQPQTNSQINNQTTEPREDSSLTPANALALESLTPNIQSQNNFAPQIETLSTPTSNTDISIPENHKTITQNTQNTTADNEPRTEQPETTKTHPPKRNLGSVSSLDDELELTSDIEWQTPKQKQKDKQNQKQNKAKKNKTSDNAPNESSPTVNISTTNLLAFKEKMKTNPKKYDLTFDTLCQFIEEIQITPHLLETVNKYTTNTYKLLILLQDLHSSISDRSTKTRLTKIINRIREQIDVEEDNAQDSEQN